MATDQYTSVNKRESIGLQRFAVTLDQIQHVYYGGQTIFGKTFIHLDSPINALGIKLEYKGESHVFFTNRSAGFRRKCTTNEIYLRGEIYLTGDGNNKNEITNGVFSFSFDIPEKLPCSFEGRYGRVRYSVQASLIIQTDCRISTDIVSFTVAPIFDLNNHPLAPLPISETHTKTFMGHAEPLTMSLFTPVRGYVPGQTIPLKIHLKNESDVEVKKLRIVFKKVVVYRSMENIRKHKEIVVEIDQPVKRSCEQYEIGFDVPALPPSGTICNLIDVDYTLKVEACVDVNEWYYRMFHKNTKIRANLIIGTIPLKNYEDPLMMNDDFCSSSVGELLKTVSSSNCGSEDENNLKNYFNGQNYQRSHVYRSSKPERDDPTGDESDSDSKVKSFSPMYRVYKFQSSKDNAV